MARNKTKAERMKLIEEKYSYKISILLDKMKNNTMQELWVELDKLKIKMGKEISRLEYCEHK